jgi:hypothetical protein
MATSNQNHTYLPLTKVWLSPREACDYLGCSLDLLENLRNEAEIEFSRYKKKHIWYDVRSIDRFIERNKVFKDSEVIRT